MKERKWEEIPISIIATKDIIDEIDDKSIYDVSFGANWSLQTVDVSSETKQLINDCWDELKKIRPQFGIK